MGGAEGRPQDARPLQHVLVDELDQLLAQLVLDQPLVAVIDGEREEGAAGMIDADKGAVGDEIQALDAAIIGMRAPADIGEAGRPRGASRLCSGVSVGPGARNSASVQKQSS